MYNSYNQLTISMKFILDSLIRYDKPHQMAHYNRFYAEDKIDERLYLDHHRSD